MAEYRKKLIEVALPLEAINREAQHEKSVPRRGHPATMHLWWARRPLAACRAVLFASIVDDPSSRPDLFPTEEEQDVERQRLFRIIEELVRWENSQNEVVLEAARAELISATGGDLPAVLDPFCGGGSIPLEAQRLGLSAYASDLNPVAVLLTKALIEIPPKFAGLPPVNQESRQRLNHSASWSGAEGLSDDVRYYGRHVRAAAAKAVGDLYPKVFLEDTGAEANVTAWLWARTAPCPNPACGGVTPLIRSYALSTKRGSEAWIEPRIDASAKNVSFHVRRDAQAPPAAPKTGRGANFNCVYCGELLPADYVKSVGVGAGFGLRLLAMIGEGRGRRRTYVSSSAEHERTALAATPAWEPDAPLPDEALGFRVQAYGFKRQADLYTPRQRAALAAFVDATREIHSRIASDARASGLEEDAADSYAQAVMTYLSFAISKLADWCNAFCTFIASTEQVGHLFAEQKISMVWDFLETNPFSESVGNYSNHVEWVARAIAAAPAKPPATVSQVDARSAQAAAPRAAVVATDPPYDDNIGYADLSDFFYTWLRPTLKDVYPDLFSTLLTPKSQELIVAPHLAGGSEAAARDRFREGLKAAFEEIVRIEDDAYPGSIVYGLKQEETARTNGATSSTGWESFLDAVLGAGLRITGTWPVRSERRARSRAIESNALASSIVLVVRPQLASGSLGTRKEFLDALRRDLPDALRRLQHGNIAPVDLAQAAIGPGMSIFSSYVGVLESDGSRMSIRSALSIINQVLDEILTEQEGDFDSDTRFALTWFEQHGFADGPFGEADVLARAKNTSVEGLSDAGVLFSGAGTARLLRREEMPDDWDPVADRRPTAWEAAQHLTRTLAVGGEDAAAELLRRLGGGYGEHARELAYRLFSICERKGWAQEAQPYNALVVAWPEIARRVAGTPEAEAQQTLEV